MQIKPLWSIQQCHVAYWRNYANRKNRRAKTQLLDPIHVGLKDNIELWYQQCSAIRLPLFTEIMKFGLKVVKRISGATMTPSLSLTIKSALSLRKHEVQGCSAEEVRRCLFFQRHGNWSSELYASVRNIRVVCFDTV